MVSRSASGFQGNIFAVKSFPFISIYGSTRIALFYKNYPSDSLIIFK